jgi:hypothetical protein
MTTFTKPEQDLIDFIVNVYPTRDYEFSTSWTNYLLCQTPEETLVSDVLAQGDEPFPIWIHEVPIMLLNLALQRPSRELPLFIKFAQDFLADTYRCTHSESDIALAEDDDAE